LWRYSAQVLALQAGRAQDWAACDGHLLNFQRMNAQKCLYRRYAERVASMSLLPFDAEWNGGTNFKTK
jgi:adenylate cyclase